MHGCVHLCESTHIESACMCSCMSVLKNTCTCARKCKHLCACKDLELASGVFQDGSSPY